MPPSKKKSHHRGKARRGGNSKKVGEKKDEAPDLQMERLKIDKDSQKEKADEDAALEEAIKLAAAEKEALDAAAAEIERSMTEKKATKKIRTVQCLHGSLHDWRFYQNIYLWVWL